MAKNNRNIDEYISRIRLKVHNTKILEVLGKKDIIWTTISLDPYLEALYRALFKTKDIKDEIVNLLTDVSDDDLVELQYRSLSRFINYLLVKRLAKKLNIEKEFIKEYENIKNIMQIQTAKKTDKEIHSKIKSLF